MAYLRLFDFYKSLTPLLTANRAAGNYRSMLGRVVKRPEDHLLCTDNSPTALYYHL